MLPVPPNPTSIQGCPPLPPPPDPPGPPFGAAQAPGAAPPPPPPAEVTVEKTEEEPCAPGGPFAHPAPTVSGNPVAVTVPEDTPEKTTSPEGNKVVVCPVQTDKAPNCAKCLLCQRGKRKVIVAFRVHGNGKKKFKAIA